MRSRPSNESSRNPNPTRNNHERLRPHRPTRGDAHSSSARLILITDGEVGNEPEILHRPVLTGLRLEDRHLTPGDTAVLPDLYAGEVWSLPLRLQAGAALSATLTARHPDGRAWSQPYDLSGSVPDAENAAPRLVWAQHRCRHLFDAGRRSEAIALAIAHNLACRGTSFVAWDETEKVPVAEREVYQPSLLTKVIGSAPSPVAYRAAYRGHKEANFFEAKLTARLDALTLLQAAQIHCDSGRKAQVGAVTHDS